MVFNLKQPIYAQQEYPASKLKVSQQINNKIDLFPLEEVRLLNSPFKTAQQTDLQYLHDLNADRLLYWYRKIAGIDPHAQHYGGWENGGSNILGHYLTACSQMYAATGDQRLLKKVNYIISALRQCIEHSPDHTLFNDPHEPRIFREMAHDTLHFTMAGPAFPLVNGSNPWYGLHKIYAGLRDAYLYCNNEDAKQLLIQCADWANNFASHLTYQQFQDMLNVEHGGICEVIADVYAITGDEKYKKLADEFVHQRMAEPIANDEDVLYPQHANAQIPKFVGYARLYALTGQQDKEEGNAAFNFWKIVLHDHTLVTGDNGEYERFGPADKLYKQIGYSSAETCNAYNMLKLSKELYQLSGDRKYIDYYEKTLYNDVLAAIGPDPGMFCYYLSLKPGFFKTYSTAYNSNWCCVGTGMENPAKYGLAVYAHRQDHLYINLFIPSRLNWNEKHFVLQQQSTFPESDTVNFEVINPGANNIDINIRKPFWAKKATVLINNKAIALDESKDQYIQLKHKWRKGDRIKVIFPMHLYTESTADDPDVGAIFYGPVLLAGDYGHIDMQGVSQRVRDQWANGQAPELKKIPLIVTDKNNPAVNIKPLPNEPLTFEAKTTDTSGAILLKPFYEFTKDRYSVYWDLFSPQQWQQYQQKEKADVQDKIDVEDSVEEAAHDLQGKDMFTGRSFFKTFRSALDSGYFSYKMKVNTNKPLFLVCKYWGGGWGPDPKGNIDIYADGIKIGSQDFSQSMEDHPIVFFNVIYDIPKQITQGKKSITLRFQSHKGHINTGLFECKLVTADGLNLKDLLKNQ